MGNIESNMTEQTNKGNLHIYIGPMYAGKTTKLINTYEDCLEKEETTIILTHSSEVRYSIDKLSTHDQKKISCFKYESITEFMAEQKDVIEKSSTVLIDECQFFSDLPEILHLVNKLHKNVSIFGLDGDFQRNKFGHILDLIPHCDTIEKLTASCSICTVRYGYSSPAIFSHRTSTSNEQVLVGSQDTYQSLCRSCYNLCKSST